MSESTLDGIPVRETVRQEHLGQVMAKAASLKLSAEVSDGILYSNGHVDRLAPGTLRVMVSGSPEDRAALGVIIDGLHEQDD